MISSGFLLADIQYNSSIAPMGASYRVARTAGTWTPKTPKPFAS